MSEVVKQALAALERDGKILPHEVVEAARNPESPLHPHFEWDDSAAAESYRLEQARRLIRVHVVVSDTPTSATVRAFVSLTPDRKTGGGYRPISKVLDDVQMRKQLLKDALAELETFRRKYERLRELAPVLRAIDKVTGGGRKKAA